MRKFLSLLGFVTLLGSAGKAQEQPSTEQWRPLYHFTPKKNWTNDPNGLIYLNGVYHLYNQQNPFENKWGHMSWGHATSVDLVHWKHFPIAIPETIDKDTTWRFSGCAVWDKNNTSGFCKNGGCIVAIYTADQPNLKKESQFIAYSNDGGMSFTNYDKNPVIDLNKRDFRDPNVSWNEELKKWLMVVAMPVEHQVRFYASDNLKEWKLLSEFGAGYANANWECPSLMQLPIEGEPGKMKWILLVSAAGGDRGVFMQYFVGDFKNGQFINSNPAETILTVDNGDCFYAAIPWNHVPNDKKILIGWMIPTTKETSPWKGQMSIPRDLSLRQTTGGLRLVQRPAALIQQNLATLSEKKLTEIKELKITNTESDLAIHHAPKGNAFWLSAELETGSQANAGFKIAQQKNTGQATVIGYDAAAHQLYIDRTKAGDDKLGKENLIRRIELPQTKGKIKLQIVMDKSSLEVFVNDGEQVFTSYIFPSEGADGMSVFSEGGIAVFKSIRIWDLSGVKNVNGYKHKQ
jgi:fructan beta-fructosidase